MGDEFIKGYIALAEGEKDPRNLLLAFSIDRVICLELDITSHVEVRDLNASRTSLITGQLDT